MKGSAKDPGHTAKGEEAKTIQGKLGNDERW